MTNYVQWWKGKNSVLLDRNMFVFFRYFLLHCIGLLFSVFSKHLFINNGAPIYRSDRELLGPNNQYLPKIVSVFAEV